MGQRVGHERRRAREAEPGAWQERCAGWVTGAWPGLGLPGRPRWALEAAGSSCRAARVMPALICQLSDCIGFPGKQQTRWGCPGASHLFGNRGCGHSCPAAPPPAGLRVSPLGGAGSAPYCVIRPQIHGTQQPELTVALSSGCCWDSSDQCCQPPAQPRSTAPRARPHLPPAAPCFTPP